MAKPNANMPKPMLIIKTTGGSGTDWADTLLVVFTGVVACYGAISEPLCRLPNASEVAGKDKSARAISTEEQITIFILPPWLLIVKPNITRMIADHTDW